MFASRHAVIRDSINGASWQMDFQELNCLMNISKMDVI